MNIKYNSRVSSKNSERLLKNLQNTPGVYFFLPHPVGYRERQNEEVMSAFFLPRDASAERGNATVSLSLIHI